MRKMTEIECLVPPVPMAGRCLDQHRKKGKWEGKREKKMYHHYLIDLHTNVGNGG
jgi:hypothetical protein